MLEVHSSTLLTASASFPSARTRCALVLGNEGGGIDPKLEGESVTILKEGAMESLNVAVAGGILMHGLKNG